MKWKPGDYQVETEKVLWDLGHPPALEGFSSRCFFVITHTHSSNQPPWWVGNGQVVVSAENGVWKAGHFGWISKDVGWLAREKVNFLKPSSGGRQTIYEHIINIYIQCIYISIYLCRYLYDNQKQIIHLKTPNGGRGNELLWVDLGMVGIVSQRGVLVSLWWWIHTFLWKRPSHPRLLFFFQRFSTVHRWKAGLDINILAPKGWLDEKKGWMKKGWQTSTVNQTNFPFLGPLKKVCFFRQKSLAFSDATEGVNVLS